MNRLQGIIESKDEIIEGLREKLDEVAVHGNSGAMGELVRNL